MHKLIYTPKALDDLQAIKEYICLKHGGNFAKKCIQYLTASARQLEKFPEEGPHLEKIMQFPTEYRYMVVSPNYLIYRIEEDSVKIIRVLNEKQDFMQILFGIRSASDENEEYWKDQEDENVF